MAVGDVVRRYLAFVSVRASQTSKNAALKLKLPTTPRIPVEWGKISPPFTSKCLYFRTVQLIKKIVLSKTCMVIGTNDSHITYSDVAIISPCFFFNL